MSNEFSLEQFRAELYMEAVKELRPLLESASAQMVTAHLATRDAMAALTDVERELKRLDILTDPVIGVPVAHLKQTLTIDDLVRRYESESFVYFIEAGEYIKIGYSRDPISRLSQIRKGGSAIAPEGLATGGARILAVEQGGMEQEKALHKRFAEYRAAGEWFAKNDRLAHYIKSLATPA